MSILQELVYSNDYDVVYICETWLNDSVMSAEILTGYNIYRKDRPGRTGGGVLIAVMSDIRSSHRKDVERDNIEFAVVELVKDSTKSVILYTVYLPEPRQDELHQLSLSLQGNPESACVVIVGDFNLPTLHWSPDESVLNYTGGSTENNEFCVLMKDNFLQQFIRGPTHIARNKLDFLLSNSPEIIDNISTFTPVESKFPSDHYLVNFSIRLKFKRAMSVKRKSYNYMRANFEYLRCRLQRLSPEMLETNDVDIYWSQWKNLFLG
jgi:endonuclease/exonuclease/phosphatase family metal-dependent hydrolase